MDEPKYLTDAIIPSLKSEVENSIPKLYGNYSTATDGANTAYFIDNILNNYRIAIGKGASAGTTVNTNHAIAIGQNAACLNYSSNDGSMAIGYAAKAGSSTTAYASIAIGKLAESKYIGSVALGDSAVNSRPYEVSFGTGVTSQLLGTRYLANVKAGEKDTDAVNLKQMKDAIASQVGDINTLLQALDTGVGV